MDKPNDAMNDELKSALKAAFERVNVLCNFIFSVYK